MSDHPSDFPLPPNIVGRDGQAAIIHGERLFLSRVFLALREELGTRFEDWNFTLIYRQAGESDGIKVELYTNPGKRNALLLLADEHERFPVASTEGFDIVFRQYLNRSPNDGRIHPFPVGYHEACGVEEPIPLEERSINLFFSGYLNRNRIDFFKQFRRTWWLPRRNLGGRHIRELSRRLVEKLTTERDFSTRYPNSIIRFTEWFAKGLPPAEYAKTLANTKIAICPTGFISAETIRHWEAMRLGCVIITDPLPANRFYQNSPMIVMKDWSGLHAVLEDLNSDPAKLVSLHKATVEWWKNHCCEEAVARYMAKLLTSEP